MTEQELPRVTRATRNGLVFMHGSWMSVELYEYIRGKGPRAGSQWVRYALSLVMEAEIRKGIGIRPAPQVPDAGDGMPDAEEVRHE